MYKFARCHVPIRPPHPLTFPHDLPKLAEMRKRIAKRSKKSFDHLPHELIIEIFTKLPVKSLCRFKTVSKSIHSTITSPQFVTKNRPATLSSYQMLSDHGVEIYSIDQTGITTHIKSFQLVHGGVLDNSSFCNGLICFVDNSSSRLNVFNPTTGVLFPLFRLPLWSSFFQFGFHPDSNQYKVLCWTEYEDRDPQRPCTFQILTLAKHYSWKYVDNCIDVLSMPESAVNVNGYLFWLDDYAGRIISFDLGSEEFRYIELDPSIKVVDMDTFSFAIFEFEGGLCLVEKGGGEGCYLEIVNMWMLKDVVNSVWVSILKNVVLPLGSSDLGVQGYSHVYGQGGEVMVLCWDNEKKDVFIYAYSCLNGQLRRIAVVETPGIHIAAMTNHVANYVNFEQLVLVPPQIRSVRTGPFYVGWVRKTATSILED